MFTFSKEEQTLNNPSGSSFTPCIRTSFRSAHSAKARLAAVFFRKKNALVFQIQYFRVKLHLSSRIRRMLRSLSSPTYPGNLQMLMPYNLETHSYLFPLIRPADRSIPTIHNHRNNMKELPLNYREETRFLIEKSSIFIEFF